MVRDGVDFSYSMLEEILTDSIQVVSSDGSTIKMIFTNAGGDSLLLSQWFLFRSHSMVDWKIQIDGKSHWSVNPAPAYFLSDYVFSPDSIIPQPDKKRIIFEILNLIDD